MITLFAKSTADYFNQGAGGAAGNFSGQTFEGFFGSAISLLLYIVGALSVIFIIYGGFRFITSNGDSKAVASAKAIITYAVIGLVVALLALVIVQFVVASISGGGVSASPRP